MDQLIFEKLNGFVGKNHLLDIFAIFFSNYAGYVLAAAVILVWFFKKDAAIRRLLLLSVVSALVARMVVVEPIRFFYNRPRPFEVLDMVQLIRHSSGHSFPSGHAAFYFGLSCGVYLYNKKLGVVFFIVSALISLSRVYAGIHWSSDILIGGLIGILIAPILYHFFSNKKPA